MSINENFKIAANAVTFKLLTEKLYTMPFFSTIRELVNNAYDSYVDVTKEKNINITDIKPIEVNISTGLSFLNNSYNIRIRDYGTGLSKEKMEVLYTTYFGSDKSNRDDLIGGFGIGSKSPLSLTSEFVSTSYYNRMKYTYLIFLDTMGMPSFTLLEETKTNEDNGLEIMFKYDNNQEIDNFIKGGYYCSIDFLKFYPMPFMVNNQLVENTYYTNMSIIEDNPTYKVYSYKDDQLDQEIKNVLYSGNERSYSSYFRGKKLFIKIKNNIYTIDNENIVDSIYHTGLIIEIKKPLDLKLSREDIELNEENMQIFKEISQISLSAIVNNIQDMDEIKQAKAITKTAIKKLLYDGIGSDYLLTYPVAIENATRKVTQISYRTENSMNLFNTIRNEISKNPLQKLYFMLSEKMFATYFRGENNSSRISYKYNSNKTTQDIYYYGSYNNNSLIRSDDEFFIKVSIPYIITNILNQSYDLKINTSTITLIKNYCKVNGKYISAVEESDETTNKSNASRLVFNKNCAISNVIVVANASVKESDVKSYVNKQFKDNNDNLNIIVYYLASDDNIDTFIDAYSELLNKIPFDAVRPKIIRYDNTNNKLNYNYLVYRYNKAKQYTEIVEEVNNKSHLIKSVKLDNSTLVTKTKERLNEQANVAAHNKYFNVINTILTKQNKNKAEIKLLIIKNSGKEQDEFTNLAREHTDKIVNKEYVVDNELINKVINGIHASIVLTHKHENYLNNYNIFSTLPIDIIMKEKPRYDILEKVIANNNQLNLDIDKLNLLLSSKDYIDELPVLIQKLINSNPATKNTYKIQTKEELIHKIPFYNSYSHFYVSDDESIKLKKEDIQKKIYFNIKCFCAFPIQ